MVIQTFWILKCQMKVQMDRVTLTELTEFHNSKQPQNQMTIIWYADCMSPKRGPKRKKYFIWRTPKCTTKTNTGVTKHRRKMKTQKKPFHYVFLYQHQKCMWKKLCVPVNIWMIEKRNYTIYQMQIKMIFQISNEIYLCITNVLTNP